MIEEAQKQVKGEQSEKRSKSTLPNIQTYKTYDAYHKEEETELLLYALSSVDQELCGSPFIEPTSGSKKLAKENNKKQQEKLKLKSQ